MAKVRCETTYVDGAMSLEVLELPDPADMSEETLEAWVQTHITPRLGLWTVDDHYAEIDCSSKVEILESDLPGFTDWQYWVGD